MQRQLELPHTLSITTADPRIISSIAGNRCFLLGRDLFIVIFSYITDILYNISISYKTAAVKCSEHFFNEGYAKNREEELRRDCFAPVVLLRKTKQRGLAMTKCLYYWSVTKILTWLEVS